MKLLVAVGGASGSLYARRLLETLAASPDVEVATCFSPCGLQVWRHELGSEPNFPFRRYQVGPVWRADKPDAGRFRPKNQQGAWTMADESFRLIARQRISPGDLEEFKELACVLNADTKAEDLGVLEHEFFIGLVFGWPKITKLKVTFECCCQRIIEFFKVAFIFA